MINVPQITQDLWPQKVTDLSEETQLEIYNAAGEAYRSLIKLQFQLSYHAHISIRDLDEMSHYEYLLFFEELKEQKEAEKKAVEEASQKSKKV